MNATKAIGFLIAGHINNLVDQAADPEFGGCCSNCCGPCAALKWMCDNMPGTTNGYVMALEEEGGYDWQNEDGTINWFLVSGLWEGYDKTQCCEGREDED